MQESATQTLASRVVATEFDQLPPEVVLETKRILLDVLGSAVGSVALDKPRIAIEFARLSAGRNEASVLGTTTMLPAASAAFANGELMHATDHCPILPPAHITPYVTSAPLALAEAAHVSGKILINAIAIAHEVAARVGLSLDPMRATTGGIAPSWGLSFDAFGASAGAAKVLKLEADPMADALGLAGYLAPVPSHNKFLATPEGGGMAKYGSAGWTAQAGATAALMASMGYRGDRSVLDGDHGFWAMTGSKRQSDPSRITAGWGKEWNILRVMYKRWPCAGNLQSVIGAFTSLVAEHNLIAEEIERVAIQAEAYAMLPRFQYGELQHNVDAQTNLPYNIALVAHGVPVSSAWQHHRHLDDPAIRSFMKRVAVEAYPRAEETRHQEVVVEGRPYIERRPSRVEVAARGTTLMGTAEYAHWLTTENPAYRATDDDLVAKFMANGSNTLPRAQLERAVAKIMALETVQDTSELMEDLVA